MLARVGVVVGGGAVVLAVACAIPPGGPAVDEVVGATEGENASAEASVEAAVDAHLAPDAKEGAQADAASNQTANADANAEVDAGDEGAVDASPGGVAPPPPPPPPPPPSCGGALAKTGFLGKQTITVDGVARTYELFVPPAYDGTTRFPVILVFHGDGGTGAGVRAGFPIEAASAGGAVVAYPDGQAKTWQIDATAPMMRDVAFVDALVTHLQGSYCGDGRSFLTGISRGGYFVNQVACRTSVALAGVASHAGGGPFGILDSEYDDAGHLVCPSPPVAAMQVHGTTDGVVSITEGRSTRDHWRRVNACTATTDPAVPSPCVAYRGCSLPEVWCAIPNLGHTFWAQSAGATWSFFAAR